MAPLILVTVIFALLLLALCLGGLYLLRVAGRVVSEFTAISANTAQRMGEAGIEAVGEATRQMVETVAREVAAGIGEQLRGGGWAVNEPVDGGEQVRAFVPWEAWGEEGEGDGDVRWTPDPTDEAMPDPDVMDNRTRTVSVPPGYSPMEDMQGTGGSGGVRGGPARRDLSGERYRVE